MRNLLALLAAGLLAVAGLGWYLGWYHVTSSPAANGHQQISIDLDQKKITTDIRKGVQEGTREVEGFLKKETQPTTSSTSPSVPVAPQTPNALARFRYNPDGSIEYTGEVSVPVPVK
ncbi:MAG: hypothetical protein JOZ17_14210 [Acetobacteraceae bacterium]|nr:hypothetical protein [Acetobacteraceae bacterium]